jgi:glycosyltransferase involved in cell wall biosynthesis
MQMKEIVDKVPVSIVIPAFNEEQGVGPVVIELREVLNRHGVDAEIIVVDDGSRDKTAEKAAEAGARVFRHSSNRGYGASLKTGISGASHEYVVMTDADGTYPCAYIPEMLSRLADSDMVVGARIGSNVKIPLSRRPAKWVLNRLANYVSASRIPDLNSGLRTFRRNVALQYFPILPDKFSWTTTITLTMLCDRYTVTYIPIDYRARRGSSKIVPWDAGRFLALILRAGMVFRPLRMFLPVVMLCLLYGVLKSSIDVLRGFDVSISALLAFATALIVMAMGMLADGLTRLGRLGPQVPGVRSKGFSEASRGATAGPPTTPSSGDGPPAG